MGYKLAVTTLLCLVAIPTYGQVPNAEHNISPLLIKCYQDHLLLQRNYRFPATMEILIALIRKIEDKTPLLNSRELAPRILQTYRQDGILKSIRDDMDTFSTPYSSKGDDASKNKIILTKLIPFETIVPYQRGLPTNATLNNLEKCSLHWLVSKTFEIEGDETEVCKKTGNYFMGNNRDTVSTVERLGERVPNDSGIIVCPVETGSVYTKWGAVTAGNVIAGIATGLNQQKVPIRGRSSLSLDSRYGATIAGDLAEVALLDHDGMNIGVEGVWNSSLIPKWYFINKIKSLELTDAEIRGDLDGLYLALAMDQITAKYKDIRVSQILDMYYSPRGILNDTLRACNRKLSKSVFTNTLNLINQTTAFAFLLAKEPVLDATIATDEYNTLADHAVKAFEDYLPKVLIDPSCSTNQDLIVRAATSLNIFLDAAWPFDQIQGVISYLIENIDVNRYGSRYTILNAKDGSAILGPSNTILDYHEKYNETIHLSLSSGTDYTVVSDHIEQIIKDELNDNDFTGGTSSIFLIVPFNAPTADEESRARDKLNDLKKKYKGIKTLLLGPGEKANYVDVVTNQDSDVIIVDIGAQTENTRLSILQLANRIKEIPRNIVNPRCGAEFKSGDKVQFETTHYVEPTGINYHYIAPNYFSDSEDTSRIIVKAAGYGSFSVCTTRTNITSQNNSDCTTIKSTEEKQYSVSCDGKSIADCDPFYISVQAVSSGNICKENTCRFPDNIKYTISLDKYGCAGGGGFMFTGNIILTVLLIMLARSV